MNKGMSRRRVSRGQSSPESRMNSAVPSFGSLRYRFGVERPARAVIALHAEIPGSLPCGTRFKAQAVNPEHRPLSGSICRIIPGRDGPRVSLGRLVGRRPRSSFEGDDPVNQFAPARASRNRGEWQKTIYCRDHVTLCRYLKNFSVQPLHGEEIDFTG